MASVMHINAVDGSPEGPVPTLCGDWLEDGEGAEIDAPKCEQCFQLAGLDDALELEEDV